MSRPSVAAVRSRCLVAHVAEAAQQRILETVVVGGEWGIWEEGAREEVCEGEAQWGGEGIRGNVSGLEKHSCGKTLSYEDTQRPG